MSSAPRTPRRCLITGATGFVGSRLAARLHRDGWQVRILVRASSSTRLLDGVEAESFVGALDDPDALGRAMADVDVVFHVAGTIAARSADEFQRVNGEGARAVARAASAMASPPRRVVFVSSISAAGPAREGRPRVESDEAWPVSDYGRSKLTGERALLDLDDAIEGVVIRPPVVYGPADRATFPLYRAGRWGIVAKAPPDGLLSFIYIDDLVDVLVRAATVEGIDRRTYYVAGPEDGRMTDLQTAIAEAFGAKPRVIRVPGWGLRLAAIVVDALVALGSRPQVFGRDKLREGDQADWRVDATRARHELGFAPQIGLREGARRAAAWYRTEGWL